MLVSETDDELHKVVNVPFLIEINHQVSIAIWAALRNPTFVKISTFVGSWISADSSIVKDILVRIEIVKCVDNIGHTFQKSIVIKSVELVVRP